MTDSMMSDSILRGARVDGGPDPRAVRTDAQFAAALAGLRLRAGLSIRDVARATGIPSATLGGYFSGRHLPPTTQPQQFEQLLSSLGVTDSADLDAWRDALLRVRRSGPGRAVAPEAGGAQGPGASPYRGLEPFTDQDAGLFFGREAVVDEIVAAVEQRAAGTDRPRVLIVVGPSGSGKSSVLRAGLVPRMRRHGQGSWAVSVMVPGADPMAALDQARSELGEARHGLLVIDQAEEVFSPLVEPEQRAAFVRELIRLARGRGIGERSVVVVAGLRADFYGQALADPDLLPALQSSQVPLGSMPLADLRRAVLEPARVAGVTVDPELVDLLVRDLTPRGHAQRSGGYDAGALPLVSHALLATWQHHRGDRMTVADYVAAGGIVGAVQQTAESVVASLDHAGRAAAQWLFGQLVVVDDDGVMTRRRVRHDDLRHPHPPTDLALDAVIEAFVAGRLLTAGDGTLEISHEALLSAWPRLRDWLLSDLDEARLQRRIAYAAELWRERDRDPAALLRGGPLADAQALAAQPPTSHRVLTAAEQEFVAASTDHERAAEAAERARATRLRRLVAVMTALALLAGMLSVVALRAGRDAQRQQQLATQARDEALSRQLAITADELRAKDPALAAQLAVAALRAAPTVQARSSLLDSTAVPTPTRFVGPDGEMHAVASPDGAILAISGADGVTRLWRRDSSGAAGSMGGYAPAGELSAPEGGGAVYSSAFSRDGAVLAVGNASGSVALWDLRTPESPRRMADLDAGDAGVLSLAFSSDGQLAAGTSGAAVLRWAVDVDGGAPVALRPITDGFGGSVHSVAFHPERSILATGSGDGTIRLWSTPGDRRAGLLGSARVGDPTNFVFSVAFSPDGTRLASGEKGEAIRIWDVRDPSAPVQQGASLGAFASWVNSVAFSPDGRTVAGGSSDGSVQLFSVADGRATLTLPGPGRVTSVHFVGTGSALLTSEVNGVGRLWPLPGPVLGPFADTVWSLIPSSDGSVLAVGPGAGDGAIHLVSTTGTAPGSVEVLRPPSPVTGTDGAAGMSLDGRWVAGGTATGEVVVWERDPRAGTSRLAGVVTLAEVLVEAIAVNAQGTLVAGIADDGAVGVWSLRPGAAPVEVYRLGVPGIPLGVAFSPDSSLLAVGTSGSQVHLWRIPQGPAAVPPGDDPALAAVELPALTGFENYVYALTFDPTGRYLAAGSTDRTARIWDVGDPARATAVGGPIRGPRGTVYSLDWSADGTRLAGASTDGTVWMWDVSAPAEPEAVATIAAAGGNLNAVAFSPDDRTVWAGGSTARVHSWQVDAGDVAATTCARTGTAMSAAEWEQLASGAPLALPCPA